MSKARKIKFTNNQGQVIYLPDNLTMHDLTVMGIRVELIAHETVLPDGVYVHDPKEKP